MKLQGKVVAVTGALGALGRAMSAAAEAAGARVARIDYAKAAAPGELVFDGVDLADESAAARTMARIAEACGRLEGLVNIAGGFTWQTVADSPASVWESMFKLNVLTAVIAS